MKTILIISTILVVAHARPEPPSDRYGPPAQPKPPQQQYGPPAQQYGPPASEKYLPPPPPKPQYELPIQEYGPPAQEYGPPAQQYGPPAQQYGPPPASKIVTKNIYVHVPPEEPAQIIRSAPIEVPTPKMHYKIIFIKAPNAPSPTSPVIPAQPQDEHKTLVYVLVKKPEQQPDVVVPAAEPTEPSKPEVYFIKYKNNPKPAAQYGPPGPY